MIILSIMNPTQAFLHNKGYSRLIDPREIA